MFSQDVGYMPVNQTVAYRTAATAPQWLAVASFLYIYNIPEHSLHDQPSPSFGDDRVLWLTSHTRGRPSSSSVVTDRYWQQAAGELLDIVTGSDVPCGTMQCFCSSILVTVQAISYTWRRLQRPDEKQSGYRDGSRITLGRACILGNDQDIGVSSNNRT
jgi:hypothetical protein